MATASDLQQLYVGYFGRAADQAGLNFWLEAINNGGLTLENVHTSFVQSAEYTAKYTGLTSAALVAQVYLNVLGRPVDAAGQTFWANAIDTGVITQAQLIQGVLSGLSAGDQAIINNKVTVASFYTAQRGAEFNTGDIATSGAILTPVNGTTASVSAALNTIATTVPGQTASSAAVTAVLNTYLSAAKAEEDFAKTVIDPISKKAVVDGDVNNNGKLDIGETADGTVVPEAKAASGTTVTNAVSAASTASVAVTGQAIVPGDSATVIAAKLTEATTKAAAAVATAQAAVDAKPGLTAAIAALATAKTNFDNAVKAADAAALEVTGELAKFDSIVGTTATYNSATFTVTVPAVDPLDPAVNVIVQTNGQAALDTAYAATLTGPANAAKLAAANALLADVQAAQAAAKTVGDTTTAATTAFDNLKLADTTATHTAYKLTAGTAFTLETEKSEQTKLATAISELNAANAVAKQLKDLGDATQNADAAIDTVLAGGLKVVGTDAGAPGSAELFVFSAAKFTAGGTATLALEKGDFLSIGTGYTKGTDTDAVKTGIQGGNDSVLEVFFNTSGASTEVVVEKTAFGSSAVVPEIVTITLTGVTADKLAFDAGTGLISVA